MNSPSDDETDDILQACAVDLGTLAIPCAGTCGGGLLGLTCIEFNNLEPILIAIPGLSTILAGLLAAQHRVGLILQSCFQRLEQPVVGLAAGVGGLGEDPAQLVVVLHPRRHDDPRIVFGHVPLRELRVGEVPVPDQFVGARPGDAGDVDRDTGVLEYR